MEEWKEVKLGNITAKIGSGATPLGGSNAYKEEGISLIRSQNVLDLQFSSQGLAFIDQKQADGLRNVTVNKDDVLLNITGDSVARICLVPDNILPARVNQHVAIIRADKEKAVSGFLLYNLISQKQELLIQSEIGATRKAITKAMLERFEILLPPLAEQRAIASVLSSLDDKIDLLHRQNETLEQMAETLFRQWFVEEAEEDLQIRRIKDYANHLKESILPQKEPNIEFVHFSIPSFDDGKTPVKEKGKEIRSTKYVMSENSILFSKLNPHKDKRLWLIQDYLEDNSICSTEFQIVKPQKIEYLYFIYGWLNYRENYRILTSGVGGTSSSHQRINPKIIFEFTIPFFDDTKIKEYHSLVKPMFNKTSENSLQIRTLTQLRNTLLPKLMSGEVRVKEDEKIH